MFNAQHTSKFISRRSKEEEEEAENKKKKGEQGQEDKMEYKDWKCVCWLVA